MNITHKGRQDEGLIRLLFISNPIARTLFFFDPKAPSAVIAYPKIYPSATWRHMKVVAAIVIPMECSTTADILSLRLNAFFLSFRATAAHNETAFLSTPLIEPNISNKYLY